jgi:phosphohistidine phosphatase
MLLYLIRHAHALPEEEDARRPLSARGRDTTERLGAFFRANAVLRPAQVWHSPLVRARETAEILVRQLSLSPEILREAAGLRPEDEPADIASRLEKASGDLALVGHEPHLSALATLLVRGTEAPVAFAFKKSAVLCLESAGDKSKHRGPGCWCVRWHFSPELLPPVAGPKGSRLFP